jgi:hypothetical protein
MKISNLLESFILIQEAREDFIADKMGDAIMKAYQQDNDNRFETPLEVVKELAKAGNKFVQAVANWYVKGEFKLNELPQVKQTLDKFTKVSKVLDNKDINKYNSLADVNDAVEKNQGVDTRSNKEQAKDITKFYEDKYLSVLIPHTEKAACKYGANTRWCTSAKKNNQFDYYNAVAPLYIITTNEGEKFQIQFKGGGRVSFVDSNDDQVDDPTAFIEKLPSLKTAFNDIARKNQYIPLIIEPTDDEYLAALDNNPEIMQNIKNPSEEVQLQFVKRNPFYIRFITNPTEKTQLSAVKNNGYAIEYIKNPPEAVQLAAVDENKESLTYIDNPTDAVKRAGALW